MAVFGCVLVIAEKRLAQFLQWHLQKTVPTCEELVTG